MMQSFRGSEIVSNVNVTVRYETGDACKAVGKFQACKQQSVTKQAKPARQSANFKRASNSPLRNRRSLQGSRQISNVQATVRYETGEACKAVGKLQARKQQSVTKQAKPAALNMPPESRGRLKARAPCLRARRCPFPARTPATRRKALFSRSVPPAARWCPVR